MSNYRSDVASILRRGSFLNRRNKHMDNDINKQNTIDSIRKQLHQTTNNNQPTP
jgi:hypothetical protein